MGEAMIELTKQISQADSSRMPTPVEPARESLTIKGEDRQKAQRSEESQKLSARQRTAESQREVTREDADQWAEFANEFLNSLNVSLRFKVQEDTNNWYMQLVDSESGEVVREIPPEEILKMAARIREMMDNLMARKQPVGVLLDHKQ